MVSAEPAVASPHKRMAIRKRTEQHSSNRISAIKPGVPARELTLVTAWDQIRWLGAAVPWLAFSLIALLSFASEPVLAQSSSPDSSAAALYRKLRDSGLDLTKVYRVRDATFDREDL